MGEKTYDVTVTDHWPMGNGCGIFEIYISQHSPWRNWTFNDRAGLDSWVAMRS